MFGSLIIRTIFTFNCPFYFFFRFLLPIFLIFKGPINVFEPEERLSGLALGWAWTGHIELISITSLAISRKVWSPQTRLPGLLLSLPFLLTDTMFVNIGVHNLNLNRFFLIYFDHTAGISSGVYLEFITELVESWGSHRSEPQTTLFQVVLYGLSIDVLDRHSWNTTSFVRLGIVKPGLFWLGNIVKATHRRSKNTLSASSIVGLGHNLGGPIFVNFLLDLIFHFLSEFFFLFFNNLLDLGFR